MGELIALLIFFYWLSKIMNKKKKSASSKPKPASAATTDSAAVAQRAERARRMYDEIQRRKAEKQRAEANNATMQPTKPVVQPAEGEGIPGSWLEQPAQEYMGSLQADSSEGEDLCDPSLGHERPERIKPDSVYAGEIGREPALDLSARGVMQGVIMSEVLKRPAQRRPY